MKHGPIAPIDDKMPIVVIRSSRKSQKRGIMWKYKVISNIQEVKARGETQIQSKSIAIINEGDEVVNDIVDYSIEIPN